MSKQRSGLLEEVKGDRPVSGRTPVLLQIAEQLNENDKKDLIEAVNDHSISSASIARALKRRGFNITPGIIQAYRRGDVVRELA